MSMIFEDFFSEKGMTESEFLYNLIFIQDSREQLPYTFPGRKVEVQALAVGDYSIKGLHESPCEVSVERKSLSDLAGTLSTGRDRFQKELEKARNTCRCFHLVIEGSLDDILQGKHGTQMNPGAIIQSLVCYSIRYGIPIWFAHNRQYAEMITLSILEKAAREHFKRFVAMTKR